MTKKQGHGTQGKSLKEDTRDIGYEQQWSRFRQINNLISSMLVENISMSLSVAQFALNYYYGSNISVSADAWVGKIKTRKYLSTQTTKGLYVHKL